MNWILFIEKLPFIAIAFVSVYATYTYVQDIMDINDLKLAYLQKRVDAAREYLEDQK